MTVDGIDEEIVTMKRMTIWAMRHFSTYSRWASSTKHVDAMRDGFKMPDIHADAITTHMIKFKAIRNGSMNIFVDPSMRKDHSAIDIEFSIPIFRSVTSPDDAVTGIDDRLNKSVNNWNWPSMPLKEWHRLSFDMTRSRRGFRRDFGFLSAAAFAQHRHIVL